MTQLIPRIRRSVRGPASVTNAVIGYIGVGAVVCTALAFASGSPPPLRLTLLTVASLYGPAVPALRLWAQLGWVEAVIFGLGVDAGLVLAMGQVLVGLGAWVPQAASAVQLSASVLVSAALLWGLPWKAAT